ncbi:MAG: hypothetical protein M1823_003188 [Watsoniomyces obsoletus]|nr:MAG: hypothetical protein M1823_003188 [Watsoniomyces obsoletus]
MAPPILGRYQGQPGMPPFGNPQQQQQRPLQHRPQPLGASGLTAPAVGAHLAFNNADANLNLFSHAGGGSNGNVYGNGFGGMVGGGTGLGSHAAQMGFAHGAALQRQEANESAGVGQSEWKGMAKGRIRDVWRNNLAQEMAVLRTVVEKYPYISMDTEFPGIVARPMGTFGGKADYHYQTLRCNVDFVKVLQLGITLFTAEGELPPAQPPDFSSVNGASYANHLMPCPHTWQFNFRFSLEADMYADGSIDVMQKSGVDFQMHEQNGIDPLEFGSYLITSGLVLNEDVRWISYHSGYDFGYLTKIMLCRQLPDDHEGFCRLVNILFPGVYDIKFLMRQTSRHQAANNAPLSPQAAQIFANLAGQSGLQELADELGVKRMSGHQHQAGPDSWVTGRIFWEIRRVIFGGHIDDDQYLNKIFGLHEIGSPAPAAATAAALAAHQVQQSHLPGNGNNMFSNNGGNANTPGTDHATMVGTPASHPPNRPGGMGAMTPGGMGVFGGFQFGRG